MRVLADVDKITAVESDITCSILNMTIGRVNTKVFPEPVNAIPIMSLPLSLQTEKKIIFCQF